MQRLVSLQKLISLTGYHLPFVNPFLIVANHLLVLHILCNSLMIFPGTDIRLAALYSTQTLLLPPNKDERYICVFQ